MDTKLYSKYCKQAAHGIANSAPDGKFKPATTIKIGNLP
jgi:hypothetical protein